MPIQVWDQEVIAMGLAWEEKASRSTSWHPPVSHLSVPLLDRVQRALPREVEHEKYGNRVVAHLRHPQRHQQRRATTSPGAAPAATKTATGQGKKTMARVVEASEQNLAHAFETREPHRILKSHLRFAWPMRLFLLAVGLPTVDCASHDQGCWHH